MTVINDLLQLRIGKETTWGTAVAQTSKLMGIESVNFRPIKESQQIKDVRGSMAPGYVTVPVRTYAEGVIQGVVSYEDLPYWFDGLLGTATPSASTEFTYAYTAPLTAEPTISNWTMAYGDANVVSSVYGIAGGTMTSLNISGEKEGLLRFTANLFGKFLATDTFDSAAEADRTVTFARGCDCKLYIDVSSDLGTTEITNTGFDFSLDINSNRTPKFHLQDTDGNCRPTGIKPARWDGSLRLGLEVNTTSTPLIDAIANVTTTSMVRGVRIVATNGVNIITLNFNGVALEAPQLYNDKDGITSVDLMLAGQYEANLGNWFTASVVNTIATLP